MPRLRQAQGAVGGHVHDMGVGRGCELADGQKAVETHQFIERAQDGVLLRADQFAQETQDLLFLGPLLLLVFLQGVVELHQEKGLEVACLARLGVVVHDALDAPLEIVFEGQDVAIRGNGQELVLQDELQLLVVKEILNLARAHLMHAADLLAHGVELGRGLVADVPVLGQAAREPRPGLGRQGQPGNQVNQAGIPCGIGLADGPPEVRGATEHFANSDQAVQVKVGHGVAQILENAGHIGKGRKAHVLMTAEMDDLADKGQATGDTVRIGFRQKRKAGIPARLADRKMRKMLQDLGIFQQL